MKTGKIIKSLSGFYEVDTESGIYRSKAKGVFRSLGVKPLVGDNVSIDITDENSDPKEGNVISIAARRNELIRPTVANIDQAMLIFAITHPVPSYNMVDRFLISMQERHLPALLCFSKADLASEKEREELRTIYEGCGAAVFFMTNCEAVPSESGNGRFADLKEIRRLLSGKTTVLAGPSGVGKSTLINRLCPGADMMTGELSRKIERGKNTTRHVELFRVASEEMTFVMDTPGFTALDLTLKQPEDLKDYYPEFDEYLGRCRFDGCNHMEEPGCAVKEAVAAGRIAGIRYENYRELYEELKNRRPVYR